ncbi:MAG: hypothetical protein HQK51_21110 [Oligoflexia bacterium]|nr:hypothetical protein [Oligoflexia bacterium]
MSLLLQHLKNRKKFLPIAIFTAFVFVFMMLSLTNALSVLPPKYLSVKNFQECLASKDMGTWISWCMPITKPALCPQESWQQLSSFTGEDKLPSCQEFDTDMSN